MVIDDMNSISITQVQWSTRSENSRGAWTAAIFTLSVTQREAENKRYCNNLHLLIKNVDWYNDNSTTLSFFSDADVTTPAVWEIFYKIPEFIYSVISEHLLQEFSLLLLIKSSNRQQTCARNRCGTGTSILCWCWASHLFTPAPLPLHSALCNGYKNARQTSKDVHVRKNTKLSPSCLHSWDWTNSLLQMSESVLVCSGDLKWLVGAEGSVRHVDM